MAGGLLIRYFASGWQNRRNPSDHDSHIMHLRLYTYKCLVYDAYMLFMIGEHIRTARKRKCISQQTVAAALGMSRTTIGQIENGTVQDIGVRKLIRILEYLGLELRVRPAGTPPTLDELREEMES